MPESEPPMPDTAERSTPAVNGPAATGDPAAATAELLAAVRRLKVWLIALTALVGLLVVAAVVAAVVLPGAIDDDEESADVGYPGMTVTDDQLASARGDIESALGDAIEGLDVRRVTMKNENPMLPEGMPGEEEYIYVTFRLTDSGVVVADILGGMFGPDAASMGMLPTQGSLASRMSEEQFARFLAAYAAQTDAPLSSVRRYSDRSEMGIPNGSQQSVVPVGDKKYKTSELWAASEGLQVEGDTLGMEAMGTPRTAYIFYEDPKSGEFTFLGTEPALGW